MKKTLCLLTLITVFSSSFLSAQTNEEFKPGGKIFGLLFSNFHTTFSDRSNTSAFEVTRSYLGFDYAFSKTFSSRILYDGTTETINGKTIYTGYLRNAYLQFDNSTVAIRGGLIGAEQISVMDRLWNYRYITKPPIDYSGMTFPADLGLMTKVKAGDKVVLDIAVTNGRGFRDIAADGTYRFSAGISVSPWQKLIFRGYYDLMGPSGRMQRTASIIGAWNGPKFSAGAEYLRQNNNKMTEGNDYSGYSIFTSIRLADKIALFARYDDLSSVTPEGGEEPWNLSKDGSNLFIGIDLTPVKNVRISPNFAGFFPDNVEANMTSTIGFNVEARF